MLPFGRNPDPAAGLLNSDGTATGTRTVPDDQAVGLVHLWAATESIALAQLGDVAGAREAYAFAHPLLEATGDRELDDRCRSAIERARPYR